MASHARKHETYSTVLIDLEQSRPIALLGDRETETLAAWLLEHPGVQVVSRDRSKAYKAGITVRLEGSRITVLARK